MIKKGIDVSSYQDKVDWDVTKDFIDFVILRCGYGTNDDSEFKRNVEECTRLQIPFGVYLHSYAKTKEDALSESKHVLRLIEGYQLSYPIYYDLEDEETTGSLTKKEIAELVQVFANTLQDAGYVVGVYANVYWFTNILTESIFNRYSRWVASYSDTLAFTQRFDIWQYSSSGTIPGIKGDVDKNYCYRNFPMIIQDLQLNGYQNTRLAYQQFNYEGALKPTGLYRVGDAVRFNYVFITSDSNTAVRPFRHDGIISRVDKGERNPYLIGQNQGWVNDQVIEEKIRYLKNEAYNGISLANALYQIKEDGSLISRICIAQKNGIPNYQGTKREDLDLLKLLKKGKLIS